MSSLFLPKDSGFLVWLARYRTMVKVRTYHHLFAFVEHLLKRSHPSLPGPDEDSHTVDFRALLRLPPFHQDLGEEGP